MTQLKPKNITTIVVTGVGNAHLSIFSLIKVVITETEQVSLPQQLAIALSHQPGYTQ